MSARPSPLARARSARPAPAAPLAGSRLLAAALARAEAFLLEPVVVGDPGTAPTPPAAARPLVAVVGVAPRCGTTTVARALAAELALRDQARAAVVVGPDVRGSLPIGTPAAGRLARVVSSRAGVEARPSGRLCLTSAVEPARADGSIRGIAAVVLEAEAAGAAGAAASVADATVLVAAPHVEPALACVLAASLARVGPQPLVLLNRSPATHSEAPAWRGRADVSVPLSHGAARLALSGRGAGGPFGAAIALLADRCEDA